MVYNDPRFRTSVIISFVSVYVLPISIMTVCYAAIVKTVWGTLTSCNVCEAEQKRRLKQRIQTMRTVAVIIVSNALHYGYFFGVILWIAHGGHTQVSERVSNTLLYSAILVAQLNTCVNPPLYALSQSTFRPYVYKILCPARYGLRIPDSNVTTTTTSTRQSFESNMSNYSCDLTEKELPNGCPRTVDHEAPE